MQGADPDLSAVGSGVPRRSALGVGCTGFSPHPAQVATAEQVPGARSSLHNLKSSSSNRFSPYPSQVPDTGVRVFGAGCRVTSLSLERAFGKNNALNGNHQSLEQTLVRNRPLKTVTSPRLETTPWLERAPGWKQPLAGNSPWLETAPGRKQPLAGDNPGLKTAPSWKRPPKQ